MSEIAFPTVLASTVHDMKNSLGVLLQSVEEILAELPESKRSMTSVGVLQYEAARVSSTLVQLLGVYKLDQNQLPLNMNEHSVADFLDCAVADCQHLFDSRGIAVTSECDDDLSWIFDHYLVGSVINNVITNSIRYTRTRILLRAHVANGFLQIEVCDDGPGYPAAMVAEGEHYALGINHSTGSTGLGLYFSGQVAQLHRRGEIHGHMALSNGGILPGGKFQLYLP